MSGAKNTAAALIGRLKQRAPEYLDLLTAETETEFDAAFDALLGKAVAHLEQNARNLQGLDEVGLSAVLRGSLSVPGLTVTQETHSNGHVDLTIEADHCVPLRRKLAEAKIYDGPAYHIKGLGQLLTRYTTGRETRGLLIVYFRKPDIEGLVAKLRNRMDKELPCNQQGATSSHVFKWSFLSVHKIAAGTKHEVGHLGCNLFVEE